MATVSFLQSSNAEAPIVVKLSGKSIAVNEPHFWNAEVPIDFNFEPTVTSVTLEHLEKASSPIVVMASGKVNLVTFLQL
nr:hypothetical protein [uncultured Prevotella sp.]